MQYLDLPDPLVVIVGPTAAGKTVFGAELARRLDGEIVSADSRLFYRGLNIGTDKPPAEIRQVVPHHLIDIADPDDPWSLVRFQTEACKAIASIQKKGRLPFLVGGTGQYIHAVIHGWQAPVMRPDPLLRAVLEKWGLEIGPEELHRRLSLVDAQSAAIIEPRNLRRTVRALEVIFTTGVRFSEQRLKKESPYSLCILGLKIDRKELYQRIDARIDRMIANGLLGEVKGLLEKGYSPDLPALSAIGYREMASVLKGDLTLDQARLQMKKLTHQFVRRQANWFKESDPAIHWIENGENSIDMAVGIIQHRKNWLERPN